MDPLCGFGAESALARFTGGPGGSARNQGYKPGKLSVLLMSGARSGSMGKSAIPKLARKLESVRGTSDFHLFSECRHELFNEIIVTAFAMLLEWIEAKILRSTNATRL